MPADKCLNCGHPFDCATDWRGDQGLPAPGDITMCLMCGELFQFTKEMKIEAVQLAALMDLTPAQHLLISKAQRHARQLRGKRK